MARPTKYNQDLVGEIVSLIRQGYTLKAISQVVGASEASLSRWRELYPDFNKAIIEATLEQNQRAKQLRSSGIRTYRRSAYLSPSYSTDSIIKPQTPPEKAKVRHEPQTWRGLPIKPRPLDYKPTDFYLNPNTKCVEQIDQNGVLHSCSMWVWEEKHRSRPAPPFIFEVV